MRPSIAALNVVALLCTTSGHATLNPQAPRGEMIEQFTVEGRGSEICVIPRHFADGGYGDHDQKREQALCSLDFYRNAAICPKLNSTNPGVDVHEVPPGFTVQQLENAGCSVKDAKNPTSDISKKVAKYKLSTSCSYTPSILGYYHLSRMLGDVLNVPPAVVRTLDRQNHLALGKTALKKAPHGSIIAQTWQSLVSQLTAGASAPRRDLLLTDKGDQSYGALIENPSDESFYKAFFNGGDNNVARTANLRDHNPIIAMLSKSGRISAVVGREFTADNVQKMVQLRDAANMIVVDTLMNQQDRMGNIHSVDRYYYLDSAGPSTSGQSTLKSAKIKDMNVDDVAKFNAVKISEMILKDNDCGVSKANIDKQAGLDNKIAHIDPQTYQRLLRLDSSMNQPTTKQFFQNELLFTTADFGNVRSNLAQLAAKLHQACTDGRLALDLDLAAHFSGQPLAAIGCEIKS